MMNLANLLVWLVVTCNYRHNIISAFTKPALNLKYNFESGALQRRYVGTKAEGQQSRRLNTNSVINKIRDCQDFEELFQLQNYPEENYFFISHYWNKAFNLIYIPSECQKIRNNPELLKPIVKITLDSGDRLNNPVSLGIIIKAIAKITLRTRSPIVESTKVFQVLERNIMKEARNGRFALRSCSDILWTLAKMNRKSHQLFSIMETQILESTDEFNPMLIANILWAYSKIGHSAPKLFDFVSLVATKKIDTFNSQEIANTMWAYATIRHSSPSSKLLFDTISFIAMENLQTFNSISIAKLMWAYAAIGYSVPKLFDAMLHIIIEKLDTFSSQEISNVMWAYATVGYDDIDSTTLRTILYEATSILEEFEVQESIKLVWSMAALNCEDVDATLPFFSKIIKGLSNAKNYNEDWRGKLSTEDLKELRQVLLWYNEKHKKDYSSSLSSKLKDESFRLLTLVTNEIRSSKL
mmetsp:Transcript_25345/g.28932  ORF Transcript_25345/g.28932 Transcript_25345/m.28932 type:complete len:468 (+) Transcript_25345:126-1529(+)